jgi:hypothetical protein
MFNGSSLPAIVRAYRTHHQPQALDEFESFRAEPSLRAAVTRAALAQRPNGKRYDHQRRIRTETLCQVQCALLGLPLQHCRSFHELYMSISTAISPIRGAGELMVYDTAIRIGAWLGLKPDHVYLHAGTRAGARALGLNWRDPFVDVESLPEALQSLEPLEVEDCLCIFKEQLAGFSGA